MKYHGFPRFLAVFLLIMTASSLPSSVYAFGLSGPDPTNPDSALRDAATEFDPTNPDTFVNQGIQENLIPVLYTQAQFDELQRVNCDEEDNLYSMSADVETNIEFANRKSSIIKVYWLDYSGKRQHYFDLRPNQVRVQRTFVSHPWLITGLGHEKANCLGIFLPTEKDGVVVIE